VAHHCKSPKMCIIFLDYQYPWYMPALIYSKAYTPVSWNDFGPIVIIYVVRSQVLKVPKPCSTWIKHKHVLWTKAIKQLSRVYPSSIRWEEFEHVKTFKGNTSWWSDQNRFVRFSLNKTHHTQSSVLIRNGRHLFSAVMPPMFQQAAEDRQMV
jgi:hypothetical protein